MKQTARRTLLNRLASLAMAAALAPALMSTLPAQAQAKLKVAAIYTVPVEQQWARSSTSTPRTPPTPTTSA